jgi:hypothetical protein
VAVIVSDWQGNEINMTDDFPRTSVITSKYFNLQQTNGFFGIDIS